MRIYLSNTVLLNILFSLLLSCHSAVEKSENHKRDRTFAVKKISDGDTFWIYNGTEEGEKIRLIGVDAPESKMFSKRNKVTMAQKQKRISQIF